MAAIVLNGVKITSELRSLIDATAEISTKSRAENTTRQYQSNWRSFASFCEKFGITTIPTPVQVLATYLTYLAKEGKTVSTISSHMSAIKYFNARHRFDLNIKDPLIEEVMHGIKRTVGTEQYGSAALLPEDIEKLVGGCGGGLIGMRDKAIILLGFSGAFRRSELVSITVEDLSFVSEGVVITIKRSKTDQTGETSKIAIPLAVHERLCACKAASAWLNAAGIESGPVFRSVDKAGRIGSRAVTPEAVRKILAKLVNKAGLEGKITPHSLRAGFCTAAAMNGADISRIATHARHASIQTTQRYVRPTNMFKKHSGDGIL